MHSLSTNSVYLKVSWPTPWQLQVATVAHVLHYLFNLCVLPIGDRTLEKGANLQFLSAKQRYVSTLNNKKRKCKCVCMVVVLIIWYSNHFKHHRTRRSCTCPATVCATLSILSSVHKKNLHHVYISVSVVVHITSLLCWCTHHQAK